jgi:predicted nucleic acid-binding protein
MEANRDGEINVYTSVLSIAECSHADGDISPEVKSAFSKLLMSGQYLSLVQPTPMIGEAARDLRWVHGMSLKGADALHLASALDRSCEEFITLDTRITRIGNAAEFAALGLALIEGRASKCLPEKYRQLKLEDGNAKDKRDRPN